MKRTKLLSLTALTLIGLLGLSSCSGEKGDKGDTGATGPTGETGPKGDKGDPGEDGEDGKDGSTWLTGTSKPADTLGNIGDMYLNTTNGDVYQKEESGWTLKMNIKGEDGEDGKDGANGSSGSQGKPGETAWSNTILPTEGGAIIPSIGSGIANKDKVTFTFIPDEGYTLSNPSEDITIVNNGEEVNFTVDTNSGENTYSVTLIMEEGGYIVSASFMEHESNPGGSEEEPATNLGTSETEDNKSIDFSGVYKQSEVTFSSDNSVVNLNNLTLEPSDNTSTKSIKISGNNLTLNISDGTNLEGYELILSGENVVINVDQTSSLKITKLESSNNFTLNGSEILSSEEMSLFVDDSTTQEKKYNIELTGTLSLKGNSASLNSISIVLTEEPTISAKDFTLMNSYVETSDLFKITSTTVLIEGNIIKNTNSKSRKNFLLLNGNLNSGSVVKNNQFDYSASIGGTLFSFGGKLKEGLYDFSGNRLVSFNFNENFLAKFSKNFSITSEHSVKLDFSNTSINGEVVDDLSKCFLIDFGTSIIDWRCLDISIDNVQLNGEELNIGDEVIYSPESAIDSENQDATISGLLKIRYRRNDRGEGNNEKHSYLPYFIKNNGYLTFKDNNGLLEIVKKYVFVNGQFYEKAVFESDGITLKDTSVATKIKFDNSGDGLSKEGAILIDSLEDWKLIKTNDKVYEGGFYFKLSTDLELSKSDYFSSFSGYVFAEEGRDVTIKTANDTFDGSERIFGNTGYLGLENINFNLNNAVISGDNGGWSGVNIGTGAIGHFGLNILNCTFEGNVTSTTTDALTNVGLLVSNISSTEVNISNNVIDVNLDFTKSTGNSYHGAIIGGYIVPQFQGTKLTVVNNQFNGSLKAAYAGYLFGNANQFETSNKFTIDVKNNYCNGQIVGTLGGDKYFAYGSVENISTVIDENFVDLGETGYIGLDKNLISFSATKEGDNITINLSEEDKAKVESIKVSYGVYTKMYKNGVYHGTLYVVQEDSSLGLSTSNLTFESKNVGYADSSDSSVLKFEGLDRNSDENGITYYLVGKDDTSETVNENPDIFINLYDNAGELIGVYKLN